MNQRVAKKLRKVAQKRINELWLKYWLETDTYSFLDRWYIAWRIIKGRNKFWSRSEKRQHRRTEK